MEHLKLDFGKNRVAIVGPNGVGKTNLLQAIYYSTYAKVYRSSVADALNITNGQDQMSVIAHNLLGEAERHAAVEVDQKGKRLYIDHSPVRKTADFIKDRNVVLITPDDIYIINGGSENRRAYIDALLAKISPSYLQTLLKHNKYLKNRNAYLKQSIGMPIDLAYLDSLDTQLAPLMQEVYESRGQIFGELESQINRLYNQIAGTHDKITIKYKSRLKDLSAHKLLNQNRNQDIQRARTTQGVHRDDLVLTINDKSAKDFASQGQKKTLLFAMKLAELELIGQRMHYKPILMIDDIFEKLDNNRIQNLLQTVEDNQLFISDTSQERVRDMLGDEAQIISLA